MSNRVVVIITPRPVSYSSAQVSDYSGRTDVGISVVVAKRIYRNFGVYDLACRAAADHEWIVRVLSSNN